MVGKDQPALLVPREAETRADGGRRPCWNSRKPEEGSAVAGGTTGAAEDRGKVRQWPAAQLEPQEAGGEAGGVGRQQRSHRRPEGRPAVSDGTAGAAGGRRKVRRHHYSRG